jgi:hypothetical protein
MNSLLGWIVAIVIFGALVATDNSYEEAKIEAEHYTDMVCNGYWPDYEERNPDCSINVEAD